MLKIYNLNHKVLRNSLNPRYIRGFFRLKSMSAILVMVMGFYFTSCTEFDEIGLDLVENKIGMNATDTVSLVAYTVIEDSVPTTRTNRHLLGFYNDPVFGKTRASIYTETRLRTTGSRIENDINRESIQLDSVVMVLAYNGSFGDFSTPQNIKVYELNDSIPSGTIYSNKEISSRAQLLNTQTSHYFAPRDSIYIGGSDSIKVPPQLRIRLIDSFGRKFIDAPESAFQSVSNFLEFFRGLHISADETGNTGGVAYFNMLSPVTSLNIYYNVVGDTISRRSRVYEFPINEFARTFTHFDNFNHQFAADFINSQIQNPDTIQGEEKLYLQAMANYKVKIQIPYLPYLFKDQKDRVAINSAQLIIPADTTFITDNFGLAQSLLLLRVDSENNLQNLRDFIIGQDYFGGSYNKEKNQYQFNITQHVQAIINEEIINNHLYLIVGGSAESAGRAVISGTNSDRPLQVKIKYTEPL